MSRTEIAFLKWILLYVVLFYDPELLPSARQLPLDGSMKTMPWCNHARKSQCCICSLAKSLPVATCRKRLASSYPYCCHQRCCWIQISSCAPSTPHWSYRCRCWISPSGSSLFFRRGSRFDPRRDPRTEKPGRKQRNKAYLRGMKPCGKPALFSQNSAEGIPIESSHAWGHWFESSSLHQKSPESSDSGDFLS